MTIRYIVKCDLCGKEHEIGHGWTLTETPNSFQKPDGWQMIKYIVDTNPETGISLKMNVMICPRCDKAIREGRTVISAYLHDELASEPVRIYTEPEVIPLGDKFPKVSEEEANL